MAAPEYMKDLRKS